MLLGHQAQHSGHSAPSTHINCGREALRYCVPFKQTPGQLISSQGTGDRGGWSRIGDSHSARAAGQELVIRTQPGQPSSSSEDSDPAPQASKQGERGIRLERFPLPRKGSHLAPPSIKKKEGDARATKSSWGWSGRFRPLGSPHIP